MLTEIFLLLFCILFLIKIFFQKKPLKFPPGPPEYFLVGNAPEVRRLSQKLGGQHVAFMELAKIYKTDVIGLKLGNRRVICVCSYDTIRKIYLSDDYLARPKNFFVKLRSMSTNKGITSANGELWKEQRAFVVSHFRTLGFGKNLREEMIKDEINDTIYLIETQKELEFSSVLPAAVLNILWKICSGKSLKGTSDLEKILKLIEERNQAFDILKFFTLKKTGYNLVNSLNDQFKKIIMDTINEHKNSWFENRDDDLIYAYLNEIKKREGTDDNSFNDDQLMMICLDMLIAGATTTGGTLDFAFLAMVVYPEVQEKVYATISKEFSSNEEISFSSRHKIPYVEAVILECQRFLTVVPVAAPRSTVETLTLNDYVIPKDTTVFINLYSVYQDKDFWKDPEVFRPERFLDGNGNIINQERVLTFGLGKRKCFGETLAKPCIFLFFTELIRKYRIEEKNNKILTAKQIPGLLLTPEKYTCKFISRS